MRLVLASASPARLTTLRAAGFDPEVRVSGIDEDGVLAATHERGAAAGPADDVLVLARAKAEAVATDLVAGTDAVVLGCDSLFTMDGRTVGKPSGPSEAVARIRSEDVEFQHAVDTATRPANIFRPSGLPVSAVVDPELFEFEIEHTLWASIEEASAAVDAALKGHANYDAAWFALKALIAPIDEYFETVMVNVDDQKLRANRLAVMRRLDTLYCRLADFREIVQ
mgnify:CR=1 FL=1